MTSFRDLPVEIDEVEDPAVVDQIEADLSALENALERFSGPTWLELASQVKSEYDDQIARLGALEVTMSGADLILVRGRVQALSWVLGLPDRIQNEIRRLTAELEAARPTIEEGEDVGQSV